jgi:flagellar protein FlaG
MSVVNSISSPAVTPGATGTVQAQIQPRKAIAADMPKAAQPKAVEQPEQKKQEPAVSSEHLQKLIARANTQMAAAGNQHLSFGYEERSNRMYVQIRDNASGEVVREIPSSKLIEQQADMSEMIGMILDRNA